MGLPPPHRVSLGRGVRPRRGWGWILRSPRQHDRGVLVAVEVLAPTAQGGFSREITPLPGALRVRSQCSKTGQSVAGSADRTAGHANPPKRRMSQSFMIKSFAKKIEASERASASVPASKH